MRSSLSLFTASGKKLPSLFTTSGKKVIDTDISTSLVGNDKRLGTADSTMSAKSDISILSAIEENFIVHTSRLKHRGIYEIEYLGDIRTGIVLRNSVEHQFPDGELHYIIDVQGIAEGYDDDTIEMSKILSKIVEQGDILVRVNHKNIGNADIYEVAALLSEIKERNEDRKLTFLKPHLFPLEVFLSPYFFLEENINVLTDNFDGESLASSLGPSIVYEGTDADILTINSSRSLSNIIGDVSRQNTHRSAISTARSNTEQHNFATPMKSMQEPVTIIDDDEEDYVDMEIVPTDLTPQHKRDWMDLIDLQNCERPKDRIKFWKHRRKEFQLSPLPLLKAKNLTPIDEELLEQEPQQKAKKDDVPIGQKFKKLMSEVKWYEKEYLTPESPNVPVSVTRSDIARDYLEERMEIIKQKARKRQIKKQIAIKLEILGKEKETDIILSLVEQQDAKKIPSRTTFVTTTKGEVKIAKVPPPPSNQMRKALKAQEDSKRQAELDKAEEDARIENERLEKRSTSLVNRLIFHMVDVQFEECIEELCENIAEVKLDNYCRSIADKILMIVAGDEIDAFANSSDGIAFYEECLVIKEHNMCERAADLIFKAVFEVELYMQSKELFKRMADVQLCEKAAERYIKDRIKKEIEFDRQEMLKKTEFYANQTVNSILAKDSEDIVIELIGIEIDHYLLLKNDIDARNKYEFQLIEESFDNSFNQILHIEIVACLVELTEFQKELEFQALLRKNEKIVDIIIDNIFNEEINEAVSRLDDGMYEDLEDFLELQETNATSRKIERRLQVLSIHNYYRNNSNYYYSELSREYLVQHIMIA